MQAASQEYEKTRGNRLGTMPGRRKGTVLTAKIKGLIINGTSLTVPRGKKGTSLAKELSGLGASGTITDNGKRETGSKRGGDSQLMGARQVCWR